MLLRIVIRALILLNCGGHFNDEPYAVNFREEACETNTGGTGGKGEQLVEVLSAGVTAGSRDPTSLEQLLGLYLIPRV